MRPDHRPFPPHIKRQRQQQATLGRSATQVDIFPDPTCGFHDGLSLHVSAKAVLASPLKAQGGPFLSWQRWDAQPFDVALRALHAQILEDARELPALLAPREHADPEAPTPRAVARRLQRMLGLRSLLELAACWQDAPVPAEEAPGWRGGPSRSIGVLLPWHRRADLPRAGDAWHLHDLRRWHWPRAGEESWADLTARHLTTAALLQDPAARLAPPLSQDTQTRLQQRGELLLGERTYLVVPPPAVDANADTFVTRVRLALSAVLDPALLAFSPEELLPAVQGARGAQETLRRLLPGVNPGPAAALAATLRAELRAGGHIEREAARPSQVAGSVPVRKNSWTVARAGQASPSVCLAAEAAAGPLHQLVPGLEGWGPANASLSRGWLSGALLEVCDLFSAVAALPADQALPLGDLSSLLTARGLLRLGPQAPDAPTVTLPEPGTGNPEAEQEAALALIPGLAPAVQAMQSITMRREQEQARLKAQACQAAGIEESVFEEAVTGEEAFDLAPEDDALNRTLSWSGGVWFLQVARHPHELVSDGRALSHCVGWGGYAQAVRAGRSRIVRVLSRGAEDDVTVPVLTLELSALQERPGQVRWQLVQARGLSNRRPTDDEEALLALWARETGVRLAAGGASPLSPGALRANLTRLDVHWQPAPSPQSHAREQGPEGIRQATTLLAAARAACWTPAATRQHQEGLRRISLMIDRARGHLQAELTRLHNGGEKRLVGTYDADDLLSGTGLLPLPSDVRPLFQAATPGGEDRSSPPGLRAQRSQGLSLQRSLEISEHWEALELRRGRQAGQLTLTYEHSWRTARSWLLDARTVQGLLEPVPALPPPPQGTGRREPALALLRSLLDEPLEGGQVAATSATAQPGETLRVQLHAWLSAQCSRRSGTERRRGQSPSR